MKHGKKPTVRQSEIIKAKRLKPEDWLIERETPEKLVVIHRYGNAMREIRKNEHDG